MADHPRARGGGPPRISVVTVVKNGARTLAGAIRSVARQAYPALEYVVVDGASTDGTLEIIRGFEGRVDRWVSEPDAGIYEAMNKATRLASGDWLLFLGADDELLVDLRDVGPLLSDPRAIYYGDAWWPGQGKRYDGPFDARKLARQNICQQAIFYPRAAFEAHAFDTRYRLLADWEFNMRCHADPRFRFEYLPVLVCRYNDASGSSTVNRDEALEADLPRLLWRHFPARVGLPRILALLRHRALRRLGLR